MGLYPTFKFITERSLKSWEKDVGTAYKDLAKGAITKSQFNKKLEHLNRELSSLSD